MPSAGVVNVRLALNERISTAVRELAMAIWGELVANTPVDTGWARANWIPAVGRAPDGPVGTRAAVSEATSFEATLALKTYRPKQGPIYITNRVPYIRRLNEGSSRQAPAMFVEAAVERGLQLGRLRRLQRALAATAGFGGAS